MSKELRKSKKLTLTQAKKKAWTQFSKFIRTRDKSCVTCGTTDNLQAGHWLPGRHPSVLFDRRNVHAQCYGCNVGKNGNPIKYYHYMERTYGLDIMKELEELDTQIIKRTPQDYLDLEALYKEKLLNLSQ